MAYQRFEKNHYLRIDNVDYKPAGYAADRHLLIHCVTGQPYVCADENGVVGLPTDAMLDDLLASRVAEVHSMPACDPASLRAQVSQETIAQAMEIDPGVGKISLIVNMADDAGIENGDKALDIFFRKAWTAELEAEHGPLPSFRTIRRWRAERGEPGRRHPRQLVRRWGRVPRGTFAQEVPSEILGKHVLEYATHPCRFADAYAGYVAEATQVNLGSHPDYAPSVEPLKIASRDTFRRWCNLLEGSATVAAKHGKQKVEQDWRGAGKPLTADFCMQRVIVDHTEIDVHVVDDERELVLGRAWLTIAVDVRSRAVVGHCLSFINPSTWTVAEILKRIALPKRPPPAMAKRYPVLTWLRGRITELIVDNASEFHGDGLAVAARTLGFHLRFCPVKRPRYRAIVERLIGTINRALCEVLPGRVLPIRDARRLDYNAEKGACILMDELEALLNQVIAEYNTSPHDGLGGRQPALVFEKELVNKGVMNVGDLDSFLRDVMPAVSGAQLSPAGIRWQGLRYHCIRAVPELLDDLVPLEPRRTRRDDATASVEFRYDPLNIGSIHVWNRRTKRYVTLVCADATYADGLPLAMHKDLRAAAKAEGAAFNTEHERLAARDHRIQAIRNIDPAAKEAARARKAELLDVPRVRRVVGNIVHLHRPETAAKVGDFIASDRAGLTAFDQAVLPAGRTRGRGEEGPRDRRDAGGPNGPAAGKAPKGRRRRYGSDGGDAT